MEQIQLELSVEEANIVLDALSKEPYVKVYQLISKIHKIANENTNSGNELNSHEDVSFSEKKKEEVTHEEIVA